LRLSSFGGYGLALAALVRVVFGAYDSYPKRLISYNIIVYWILIQHCNNVAFFREIELKGDRSSTQMSALHRCLKIRSTVGE